MKFNDRLDRALTGLNIHKWMVMQKALRIYLKFGWGDLDVQAGCATMARMERGMFSVSCHLSVESKGHRVPTHKCRRGEAAKGSLEDLHNYAIKQCFERGFDLCYDGDQACSYFHYRRYRKIVQPRFGLAEYRFWIALIDKHEDGCPELEEPAYVTVARVFGERNLEHLQKLIAVRSS